ncbi:kinase-like protein [Dacryopinax primogenitus]|uniref:non-specific serine/threonine protein kinase n=1 Tax=Dacryopinax primogenitus (strain DJM 731) TaxID=1858805 RepID=M5GA81_DACPD|nr:kinase-like protein [Dacryopinax primogenitus]EJU05714.1 kinase-like protein [Dacryopinax primogenitus]
MAQGYASTSNEMTSSPSNATITPHQDLSFKGSVTANGNDADMVDIIVDSAFEDEGLLEFLKRKEELALGYRRGGFAPLSCHDRFSPENQYFVLWKLGHGMTSTVWLCRDTKDPSDQSGFKAIKVSTAEWIVLRGMNDEVSFLNPFGEHLCMVFDVLGQPLKSSTASTYPLTMLKHILKDSLLALQYIQECGIIHTDIKPDNILIMPKAAELIPLIRQQMLFCHPTGINMVSLNFLPYEYMIVPSEPLTVSMDFSHPSVALTDFSTAVWAGQNHNLRGKVQSLPMHAPKVILNARWNSKIDMWGYACLCYEYYTGKILHMPRDTSNIFPKDFFLAEMQASIGPLPPSLFKDAMFYNDFFTNEGKHLPPQLSPLTC